ncbi:MAG: peptidoglycan-associated lipoprotein Pal [Alphaproteobacteria bacterium]
MASCKCFREDCQLSKMNDKTYNDCRDRLTQDGKLTDKDGRILVADRTFFAYDRHDLTPSAKKTLNGQAAWMMAHPETNVIISGHCDERGTREYNIGLGERRANSARDYLVAQGINPERITVISKGKDEPIVMGSSEEAWAQNRVAILGPSA